MLSDLCHVYWPGCKRVLELPPVEPGTLSPWQCMRFGVPHQWHVCARRGWQGRVHGLRSKLCRVRRRLVHLMHGMRRKQALLPECAVRVGRVQHVLSLRTLRRREERLPKVPFLVRRVRRPTLKQLHSVPLWQLDGQRHVHEPLRQQQRILHRGVHLRSVRSFMRLL